jgi:CrcB protein
VPIDRRELVAIFVGGAIGAIARVWLGTTFATGPAQWPWATFAINVSGSLALAYLVTRLQERLPISTYRRPVLGTGFCGTYTTFSTMQVEIVRMIDHHHYPLALAYGLSSIAIGYLAIWVTTGLVRRSRRIV